MVSRALRLLGKRHSWLEVWPAAAQPLPQLAEPARGWLVQQEGVAAVVGEGWVGVVAAGRKCAVARPAGSG